MPCDSDRCWSTSRPTQSSIPPPAAAILVSDEGEGFEPTDGDRLFTPFWRAEADRRTGLPGSGLGLALAARIVGALGGRIEARSRQGGTQGTAFCVHLPRTVGTRCGVPRNFHPDRCPGQLTGEVRRIAEQDDAAATMKACPPSAIRPPAPAPRSHGRTPACREPAYGTGSSTGFRRLVGMPPHVFLRRARLLAAEGLLMRGATATEAAVSVGYTNMSHFARIFRECYGCNPSLFRARRGSDSTVPGTPC